MTRASGQDLTFIVPGDPAQRTGGYIYDDRIVRALRALGWSVRTVALAGRFPRADERAREALGSALAALPAGARVVIDGLAMGALPDAVRSHAERLDITALVHHPLADETGLAPATRETLRGDEARALAAVRRVIVTSTFTAGRLRALGLSRRRLHVVEPGVDLSSGQPALAARDRLGTHQRLLCVAMLIPRKGHRVLLDALAGMLDRDWHCDCVGSDVRDAPHAATVYAAARARALDGRLTWRGELEDAQLAAAYRRADVLVLPSFYEGYGMVVTEALAQGLPVVATDGGALPDTLPAQAGLTVSAGDAAALRHALARWCDDPALRRRLRRGARRARARLSDWNRAGIAFAKALDTAPSPWRDPAALADDQAG